MSEELQVPAVEAAPIEAAPAIAEAPAAAVASEASRPFINEDGTWNRDAFGDDLGKHSMFDKYKTPEDTLKAMINKDDVIGRKLDELVSSDNPEIIDGLMKRRGVPETADGYEVAYPDSFSGLPEDSQGAIKEYFKDSATWAKENGVPKELFEKFATRDLDRAITVANEQRNAQEEILETATNELKVEWKNSFDDNVDKSDNMAKFLGMEELIPYMESNPALRKSFFDGAGKLMSDDNIINSRQQESFATLNEQLDDLDDRMIAYTGDTNDREYKRLLDKKMNLLTKMPQ